MLLNFLGFQRLNTSVMSVGKFWDVKDSFIRKNDTEYETGNAQHIRHTWLKRPLFEHNLVTITDAILISCTETCEQEFSGCSGWWSRGSLNLQLLYYETLSDTSRSRTWLFAPSAGKLAAYLHQLCFQYFLNFQSFWPIWGKWWEQKGVCGIRFGASSW